ncbi:unnamed protein product [Thlaspi arvense]|uniref:Uncharacterized protein n=1 Tax=Thlaspi arvense TaxID=13288 RepID=A0AAU9SD23_THLAR|nr:unnamed protein product [Thlaspi arvense]
MAPPFVFPQILRALEEDPEDNHRLFAQNTVDVTSLRPSDLEEFVKGNTFFGVSPILRVQFVLLFLQSNFRETR